MAKSVLTVDDSKTMRDMVSFTLKNAGYTMLEAEDGVKGLEVANANKLDLIITDLNMPNMNGLDMIRNIRKNPAFATIPILMLTTEGDANKKAEGKEAGASGWIVKPFQPEKLVEVVKKVCPV
ncbi:MAG: response regulator [Rickettsiales bacterium]|nr:response regulator [Rickettsiales bacterium]